MIIVVHNLTHQLSRISIAIGELENSIAQENIISTDTTGVSGRDKNILNKHVFLVFVVYSIISILIIYCEDLHVNTGYSLLMALSHFKLNSKMHIMKK